MESIAVARAATQVEPWREHLDSALAYIDLHAAASRNGTLCRLAGWLWRRGMSGDDVESLLLEVNQRVFQKPRAEVAHIARWIRRKPRDGGRHAALDPDVERFLLDVERAIAASSWKGRKGKTKRAIIEAHVAAAWGWRSPLYNASARFLGVLSGAGKSSVQRLHAEIIADGWLDPVQRSKANRDTAGSKWRLQIPVPPDTGAVSDQTGQVAVREECVTCPRESVFPPAPGTGLGHPLFQEGGGGFGRSVGSIVLALETHGPVRRLKTWAARAQVDPRTISRWLWMLRMMGLVAKRGQAYVRGPASFDDVARLGGLDQRAANTRKQYEYERESYRERLVMKTNPYRPDKTTANVYVLRPRARRS